MSRIFYYGSDEKVYGPVTEKDVQGWYACGYFSSDVKFQISKIDRVDRNGRFYTLGELIELNGRTLPFFFSPERNNREKEQEEKINQLMQEMDSLRTSHKECQRRLEQNDVTNLKSQVATLNESQENLLRQVKELSARRENSPATSKFETKLNELKKRVDEQEKNFASMKKEISAVTSKCDRNDTKIEKLLENQKEMEGTVNGYDSQISELKESEKAIRESLNACEQNVTLNSNQLQSIQCELSEVKKEMEDQRKMPLNSVTDVQGPCDEEGDNASPPWEKEKAPTVIETRKEREPWNKSQGNTNKGPVVAENGAKAVNPKPKTKNWDAICKELSVDEEESQSTLSRQLPGSGSSVTAKAEDCKEIAVVVAKNAVTLLQSYCVIIMCPTFEQLDVDDFKMNQMERNYAPTSVSIIRDALTKEMRRLTSKILICSFCDFNITSPRHMIYHFNDSLHINNAPNMVPHFRTAFTGIALTIMGMLQKFVLSSSEINKGLELEMELFVRGKEMMKAQRDQKILRPPLSFVEAIESGAAKRLETEINRALPKGMGISKYDLGLAASKVFDREKNLQLEAVLDRHVNDGTPFCDSCQAAFVSADEYYKHMTTYNHAMQDNTFFSLNVRMWKGDKYWDPML